MITNFVNSKCLVNEAYMPSYSIYVIGVFYHRVTVLLESIVQENVHSAHLSAQLQLPLTALLENIKIELSSTHFEVFT